MSTSVLKELQYLKGLLETPAKDESKQLPGEAASPALEAAEVS